MIVHGAKERGQVLGTGPCDAEHFGGQRWEKDTNFQRDVRASEKIAALWESSGKEGVDSTLDSAESAWRVSASCAGTPHTKEEDWFSQYETHQWFLDKPQMDLAKTRLYGTDNPYYLNPSKKQSPDTKKQNLATDGGPAKLLPPPLLPLFGYNRTHHFKERQGKGGEWAPFLPEHCRVRPGS